MKTKRFTRQEILHRYYIKHKKELTIKRKIRGYDRKYYQKHKEEVLVKNRGWHKKNYKEYYQKNREKILAKNRRYYCKNRGSINDHRRNNYFPKWYLKNRNRLIKLSYKRKDKRKEEMFSILGDKCARCGFSDKRALQVDHINNDGYKERKMNRIKMWDIIIKEGKTGKYQILCANCNWIKRAEKEAKHRGELF